LTSLIAAVGCGTWGFSYQNYTGCSPDKCTDEGACVLLNGNVKKFPMKLQALWKTLSMCKAIIAIPWRIV
jgi:hypothetical protein